MGKLEQLEKTIKTKIATTECRGVKIKGVTLSRADLDDVLLYIDNIKKYNDVTAYGQFMQPMGNVKQLLETVM